MEDTGYSDQIFLEISMKLRDLEEKQRMLKERLILIGKNLIEIREKNNQNSLEAKKEIEKLNQSVNKIESFLENLSG